MAFVLQKKIDKYRVLTTVFEAGLNHQVGKMLLIILAEIAFFINGQMVHIQGVTDFRRQKTSGMMKITLFWSLYYHPKFVLNAWLF